MRFRRRPADVGRAKELGRACGLSATAAQILLHRGVHEPDDVRRFLSPRLADLSSPDAMADRAAAADRLARAVRAGERICVFGDYDVDGTTSTTILADILEALGGRVVAIAANRFQGGYGLSTAALDRVFSSGAQVLVTCDCGSSDHERVWAAKSRGLDVIVVDHHLVPKEPLPAIAFLNPHRPECGFPFKWLTSAGLALSLGAAVRASLGSKLDVRPWLDLVALGTVADVAPLHGDNRALVRAGLERLAAPDARPGILALREIARLRPGASIGGLDIAFRLAPRINAAGRLGDPSLTLSLLRARSLPEARERAAEVERINTERKEIEQRVTEACIAQVIEIYGETPRSGVVAAGRGWHRGVVGISAARLVERFGVPALVIAIEEDGIGHGSGRAPRGFPLYDALARSREALIGFGGHQAAAGLTVSETKLDALRAFFSDASAALATGEDDGAGDIDVALDGRDFGLPTASELRRLEPVGEGNAEPIVCVDDAIVERTLRVGEGHLRTVVRGEGFALSAFGWNMAEASPPIGTRVHLIGSLRPDDYNGGDAVEMRLLERLQIA